VCVSSRDAVSKDKENIMNFKRTLVAVVVLLLVVFTGYPSFGQTSKGTIAGIVRDKTGAVVSGAKVTVTSQETSETRSAWSLSD
jgi:hypothetical protein